MVIASEETPDDAKSSKERALPLTPIVISLLGCTEILTPRYR